MKKMIFSVTIAIALISCNQQVKQTEESKGSADGDSTSAKLKTREDLTQHGCAGLPNIYVPEQQALNMIKLFKTEYVDKLSTNGRRFKSSDWIDKNVILAFQSALKNSSNGFDGVRVYFGATNLDALFILAPTKPGNHHPNVWGNKIQVTSHQFKNFNLEYSSQAKIMTESYRSKFREQRDVTDAATAVNKGLSSAVWVDKCVFDIMATFLESHPTFDGFRIHAAAYPTGASQYPPGHLHDNQSTVLFVPTENTPDHKDNFKVLSEFNPSLKMKDSKQKWLDALNHGELCPRLCPDVEN